MEADVRVSLTENGSECFFVQPQHLLIAVRYRLTPFNHSVAAAAAAAIVPRNRTILSLTRNEICTARQLRDCDSVGHRHQTRDHRWEVAPVREEQSESRSDRGNLCNINRALEDREICDE